MQLGVDDIDAHGGRDAAHRHPRASDQGLQQHVAGAGVASVPARGRMQTRTNRARPSLDQGRDAFGLEGGRGFKRRARAERIIAVALLERCLQFPKRGCVHPAMVAPIHRADLGTGHQVSRSTF
jgi:hypothetical protein